MARKVGKQLRGHVNARCSDESDPAERWAEICDYIPHDDWYSAGDKPRPDGRIWKIDLAFCFSPSGWEKLTAKAATWQAAEQERIRRERKEREKLEQWKAEQAELERRRNDPQWLANHARLMAFIHSPDLAPAPKPPATPADLRRELAKYEASR